MADMSIQKQWETPATATTALSVLDRMQALMRACTQDDVRPAAVRALEKIGFRCLVNPDLISHGIDSLGGNESVQFRDTKLLFGLAKGGTVGELRKSTACVQGFLLVAALQLCDRSEQEIAEILYEILSSSGDLADTAVSATQLRKLIHLISGHCLDVTMKNSVDMMKNGVDTMVSAIEIFTDLKRSFDLINISDSFWQKLSPRSYGALLLESFDALRDETVHHIELVGFHGAIWLTTLFLWLNRDLVGLSCSNRKWLENSHARIQIVLDPALGKSGSWDGSESQRPWEVKVWRVGQTVPSLIQSSDKNNSSSPFTGMQFQLSDSLYRGTKVPAGAIRSFYSSLYLSGGDVETLGGLVAAYVQVISAVGKVASSSGMPFILPRNVSDFLTKASQIQRSNISSYFGWILPNQSMSNASCQWIKVRDELLHEFEKHVNGEDAWEKFSKICSEVLRKYFKEDHDYSIVMQHAQGLAIQAFFALFISCPSEAHGLATRGSSCSQCMRTLLIDTNYNQSVLLRLVGARHVHLRGKVPLDLTTLHSKILGLAMGREGFRSFIQDTSKVLALSGQGRTALLLPLLHHSTELEGLLDVLLVPGTIYFNNEKFDSVVEQGNGRMEYGRVTERKFEKIDMMNYEPKISRNANKVVHAFLAENSALLMETIVMEDTNQDGSQRPKPLISPTYRNTIENIAFATHVGRRQVKKVSDTKDAIRLAIKNARLKASSFPVNPEILPFTTTHEILMGLQMDLKSVDRGNTSFWIMIVPPVSNIEGYFFRSHDQPQSTHVLWYRTFIQQDCTFQQCFVIAIQTAAEDLKALNSVGGHIDYYYGIKIIASYVES